MAFGSVALMHARTWCERVSCWEVIKRAKSEGFKKLDLGECDARVSRYKAKFDPVLEPFCYVERIDTLGKIFNFACEKAELG